MKPQQVNYLKSRLSLIYQSKPSRYSPINLVKSVAIKNAEKAVESANKIIKEFLEKESKAKEDRHMAISKSKSDVERAIYFGTEEQALAALDLFEKTKY